MNQKPIRLSSKKQSRIHGFSSGFAALILLPGLIMVARADVFTEPPWGYDTVAGRYVVCHSLEKGGPFQLAPKLWGIVGAEERKEIIDFLNRLKD